MFRKVLISVGMTALSGGLFAGNVLSDFQQAQALLSKGNCAQAAELFDKVVGGSKDELQRKARLYKALALGRDRKVDPAVALAAADAVSPAPLREYARMSVLFDRGKKTEIVAEFADSDISKWEEDYAYLGWKMRGISYLDRAQDEKALADLLLAQQNAGSDRWAYLEIEDALLRAYLKKKDYEAAIRALNGIGAERKAYGNSYRVLGPVTSCPEAYVPLKRYAEAHAFLDDFDPNQKGRSPDDLYACRYHFARARLYLAEGKTVEAREACEKALACKKTAKYYLDQVQQFLSKIK